MTTDKFDDTQIRELLTRARHDDNKTLVTTCLVALGMYPTSARTRARKLCVDWIAEHPVK